MQATPLFVDTRLQEIHRRLLEYYGQPMERDAWGPLKQFVYSLLSSRTKTEVTYEVVQHLETRFRSWENLRDAPIAEIEEAIRPITFPERKAVQLKQALEQITQRCGTLSLDFLHGYRTDKIRSWLEQFDGGGEDQRCGGYLQHTAAACTVCRQSPPACDAAAWTGGKECGCTGDGAASYGDGSRGLAGDDAG
jgi:hypothetical protein